MDWSAIVVAVAVVALVWCALVLALVIAGRRFVARELAALLLRDGRVPIAAKVALVIASLYIASPIDLIPEFIPIVGPLDDAIVAALVLRFVLRSTGRDVVRSHWHGDPSTLDRLLRLARA